MQLRTKVPSSRQGPIPKKLKIVFFLSLGSWLLFLGLWTYQASHPPVSRVPDGMAPPQILLQDSEDWMSIYFNSQKIGYSQTVKQRSVEGYTIRQDLFMKLMVLGFPRQMHLAYTASLTSEFILKDFDFKMSSGYLNYVIKGTLEKSNLKLTSDLMGQSQTQTLVLKGPAQLPLTLPYQVYRAQMKPGEQTSFSLFDPVLMAPQPVTIQAGPTEVLTLDEGVRSGQRYTMNFRGAKMTVWIDYKGRVLKEEGFLGFRLIRSAREKARKMEQGSGPDLAAEMSIPVQNPPDPKSIKKMILKLSPALRDIPQTVGRQSGSGSRVRLEQESVNSRDSYGLPYSRGDQDRYLADHPLLTFKDPRIQKALKEAKGGENEAYRAVIRLNTWVFHQLKKTPTLSLPRAVEILERREGDCNEHATLLLALLRAAGIPSRMVLGLTLLRDRFFYHAWVEAFMGTKWITLDPTFNQVPADVTHLKLAEGLEEGMASLWPVIGKLKIEIESRL
ncbi:MAG: transglutaminase domain-containing protein [Deltaproteobacteria bacterium]|nr:transglutaminase domain-containing protein [Deltaproteobacteria bacterium]